MSFPVLANCVGPETRLMEVERAARSLAQVHRWVDPPRRGRRPTFDGGAYQNERGFTRIDKMFDGKLAEVVAELPDEVWEAG